VIGGYVGVPAILGGANHIHHYLEPVFGHAIELNQIAAHGSHATEYTLMAVSVGIAIFGIFLAWVMYIKNPALPARFVASFTGLWRTIYNKWYIDELYDAVFVNNCKRIGLFLWKGFDVRIIDGVVNGLGWTTRTIGSGLRFTQSGFLHNYAVAMVVGVVVIVGYYILGK